MRNIKTLDSINIVLRKRLINRLRSAAVMSSTACLRTGKRSVRKTAATLMRDGILCSYKMVRKWLHRYSLAIN